MQRFNEFEKVYDLGILGSQRVNIDYSYEDYKVLEFNVWLINFCGVLNITDYLTDKASDMIYQDCLDDLRDNLTMQAEMAADMER